MSSDNGPIYQVMALEYYISPLIKSLNLQFVILMLGENTR